MVRLNFSRKMRMRWSDAQPQILHGSADGEMIEALPVVAGYPPPCPFFHDAKCLRPPSRVPDSVRLGFFLQREHWCRPEFHPDSESGQWFNSAFAFASFFQPAGRTSRFLPLMARFKNFKTAASSGRKPPEEVEPLLPFHSSSLGINEPSR